MKFGFAFYIMSATLLMASCNFNNDKRKSFDDVVKYNDFIVDHVNALDGAYSLALNTDLGIEVCMKKCDSLVQLCDKTTDELKGIQPFKGDSTLTMQALKYTQFMRNNGKREIRDLLKLIDNYQKADESELDALSEQIQETAGLIDARYEKEIALVDLVQKKLSVKYNFRII
jgi:hypothetical protein